MEEVGRGSVNARYRQLILLDILHQVELEELNLTVGDFRKKIVRDLKEQFLVYDINLEEVAFELYYDWKLIRDDNKIVRTFRGILEPDHPMYVSIHRFPVTVVRGDQQHVLTVEVLWTVAKLKNMLRWMHNFPSEFELQHHGRSGLTNLTDMSSNLKHYGVRANFNKFIAVEANKTESWWVFVFSLKLF